MRKYDKSLFRIGEVTKILGVTRKALLNYEALGLLTPEVKDEESGFRYYSADNMTQIRSIRVLQSLGLSLREVAEYYCNAENMDCCLQRLMELRANLDRSIQLLQVRSIRQGDLSVHRVSLPEQVCFTRRYKCAGVAEAATALRDTYIAAARTGRMSRHGRMFTMRMDPDPGVLELACCIPMEADYNGPEGQAFPETAALCVYYRGPYEGTGTAVRALQDHVAAQGIQTAGPFRSIYLEGPPNRGSHSEDYITQVAVPLLGEG